MREKDRARREVKTAGLPTIPGARSLKGKNMLAKEAAHIGYSLILKASAAEGGRGMRVVRKQDELLSATRHALAKRSKLRHAGRLRGKFLEHPRTSSFRCWATSMGKVIHLANANAASSGGTKN